MLVLIQLLEARVLRRQAALGRHVDHEQYLPAVAIQLGGRAIDAFHGNVINTFSHVKILLIGTHAGVRTVAHAVPPSVPPRSPTVRYSKPHVCTFPNAGPERGGALLGSRRSAVPVRAELARSTD